MHIIEKLRDFFQPHSDIATDVEYFCYDCYGIFHCNVPGRIIEWHNLSIVCNRCKNNSTIIHKINGISITAD